MSVGTSGASPDPASRTVDCVYIAAFTRDPRLTRICVASVRYFYPEVPIQVLAGSPLKRGLIRELETYWDTTVAPWQEGDYGSGFVKLEPLFGRPGERFMMLDADTIIAGPVLELWDSDAPFVVDEEEQPESEAKRLYYDWDKLKEVEPRTKKPLFVYNSGQWFGTAGVLTREDFSPWVEWTIPRKLKHRKLFMQGDQGVLNYMFNQKVHEGAIKVDRRKIMFWPAAPMEGVSLETVAARTAPPVVVHWAGLKKKTIGAMKHPELLDFFERYYYSRVPMGGLKRVGNAIYDVLALTAYETRVKIRDRLRNAGVLAKPA